MLYGRMLVTFEPFFQPVGDPKYQVRNIQYIILIGFLFSLFVDMQRRERKEAPRYNPLTLTRVKVCFLLTLFTLH